MNKKKEHRTQMQIKYSQQCNNNPMKKCAAEYAEFYNSKAIRKNVILYEAFFGRGSLNDCNGLFPKFMERDDFEKWQHIWVIEDFESNRAMINDYRKYKNIHFVKYLEKEYLYYLACAKILVNNMAFPTFFTKREGQTYINTWNEMSIESLGYNQKDGIFEMANTVRNFLCTDYLISSCDYQTEAYKNTFKLDGIFRGRIIVESQSKDDSKNVNKGVWDIIFKDDGDYNVINGLETKKKKILFYIGTMKVNGITAAFHSLSNLIDYDKFDVSVFLIALNEADVLNQLSEFNPKTRVLLRVGQRNATIEELTNNEMVMEYTLDDPDIKKYYSEKFYYKEYRRNFGDIKFDYVLDYSGYSAFNSVLFLQAKEAKKFIWQHSDICKDKNRTVNGEKINEKSLNTVFSVYSKYDKIVSCSESVMYVNRKSVATKETYDKFTYCRNSLNFSRVFDGLKEERSIEYEGKKYYIKSQKSIVADDVLSVEMIPLPKQKNMNFVAMGRISPEKNYDTMIRAFARFNREYPDSRLYILGDGPLMQDMQDLIRDEFCVDVVSLLGNVSNPFAFMKHCSCFILPSIYEGQPMVLLEARAIGLPIIVTDFATVADSLIENGQLLIKHDIQSIYESFVAFANGEIPKVDFDTNQYNHNAYLEFERLFEIEEGE